MKGAVIYGPGDVRFEERADPRVIEATDAVISLSAAQTMTRSLEAKKALDDLTYAARGRASCHALFVEL